MQTKSCFSHVVCVFNAFFEMQERVRPRLQQPLRPVGRLSLRQTMEAAPHFHAPHFRALVSGEEKCGGITRQIAGLEWGKREHALISATITKTAIYVQSQIKK